MLLATFYYSPVPRACGSLLTYYFTEHLERVVADERLVAEAEDATVLVVGRGLVRVRVRVRVRVWVRVRVRARVRVRVRVRVRFRVRVRVRVTRGRRGRRPLGLRSATCTR